MGPPLLENPRPTWESILVVALTTFLTILIAISARQVSNSKPSQTLAPRRVQVLQASSPSAGKRLAVIGGRGFVGRVIVRLAQAAQYSVTVIDTQLPPASEANSSVTYVAADIRDPPSILAEVLRGVSSVIHTASILPGVGISRSFMFSVNVEGTKNVVEACILAGVERLVYTSSATAVLPRGVSPVLNADESTPFPEQHVDDYTGEFPLSSSVHHSRDRSHRPIVRRE